MCEVHTLRKGDMAEVIRGFYERKMFGLALVLPAKSALTNPGALFLFMCYTEIR